MDNNDETRLVYSSEHGRMCPKCHKPQDGCVCKQRKNVPAADAVVRVSHVTKGRKGRGVTLISGVPMAAKELKDYAKVLKKKCGSGGTVKDGNVEIQGDHRETVIPLLQQQGWVVKRCGG